MVMVSNFAMEVRGLECVCLVASLVKVVKRLDTLLCNDCTVVKKPR